MKFSFLLGVNGPDEQLYETLIIIGNARILPKIYDRVQHQPHFNLIIHHTKYFPTQ